MTKIYELETARLRLRQWTHTDRAPFARINADERVMEFFPNTLSLSASYALVDRSQNTINQRGWGWWAVEVKNRHPFIGFVGLSIPSANLPFSPCVEVGWRLGYPYWGNGYATEAAQASVDFGFETLGLKEIVSFTSLQNVRSQAVMQRLGMRRTPETFNHPNLPADSKLREHYLYKLSQADWYLHQTNPSRQFTIH